MPTKLHTPMADVEQRMQLVPVEELLGERDVLVKKVADLRARHGAFGTYNDLRKILLATIAQTIRAAALRDSVKWTEAAIEDLAHADPRYVEFVTTATKERAEWAILENTIQGIADTINRGQAVARFLSSEVALAR